MIYLSGCTSDRYQDSIIELGVGLVVQPGNGYIKRLPEFNDWAADNGCYPPDPDWSPRKWLTMLGGLADLAREDPAVMERCLFALVPDLPFDHEETLRRFHRWQPVLKTWGLPVAFAIQDGATVENIPWDDFDVAFLAGSTEWKTGEEAYTMAAEARARRMWVHMGRVNSWERLDWASMIGCDSADGTFMRFGKPEDMVARIAVWLENNAPRLTQMGAQVA